MEPRRFIQELDVIEGLKNATRHSWTSSGRHESVAEHSWRMAMMAYFLQDEFPDTDMNKVIRMCLIHDLGEVFTGDIPVFEKTAAHEAREEALLHQWVSSLPEPYAGDMTALFGEMDALETPEAKLYKALDKLEVTLQHNEADISTWIPLEYTLNLTHGEKQVAFSPYLQAVKAEINADTRKKLRENGITPAE